MKRLKTLTVLTLTASILGSPLALLAADAKTEAKPKPDNLTTCPVSGDKLGEMGSPFVFTYEGQEVKLCCKDCRPKFDKEPAKFMAKIREADKTGKTPSATNASAGSPMDHMDHH